MERRFWPLLGVFLLGLSGCGSCGGEGAPSGLIEVVPENAVAVVALNLEAMAEETLALTPFSQYPDRWAALGEDVNDYLEDTFGVGLLHTKRLIGWQGEDGGWAAYIEGDFGSELGGATREIEGRPAVAIEDVWLVEYEGDLVAGSEQGIRQALAVLDGEATSLEDSDRETAESLRDVLDEVGGETLAFAMLSGDLGDLLERMLPNIQALGGASSTDVFEIRARLASDEAAEQAVQEVEGLRAMALAQLSRRSEEAQESDDLDDAMPAILADHLAHLVAEELLDLDAQGADFVITLDTASLGSSTALLGVASAVAIPAFLKYMLRAKTTEATTNVRLLYESAVAYYESDYVALDGSMLPRQFPTSVGRTPAAVPCDERVDPDPTIWEHPTWQALNFAVTEPHYYSYEFESSGVGNDASFTARAFGDLDCDGELSTFEIDGSAWSGSVEGGGYIQRENELE